jgi:hypothetical protein
MLEPDNLASVLDRIKAETHSDADLEVLRQALQEGHLSLATGERAVAVGGDVNDTVLITGDDNVLHIFKGPAAETIRQVFQQVMDSLVPRALLTHAVFSARAEQASLSSHQGPLTGREAVIAQLKAHLAERGISMMGLTRDQVLIRYLDEIIHDLAEAGYDDHYVGYLQIMAALGALDLGNQALREQVQQVVGIAPFEAERIVGRMVSAGLVERYWMTLKIASEVMADHILIHHFFDRTTRRADYQRHIIEPFLALKPKEILTNLAEAEVKGESSWAVLSIRVAYGMPSHICTCLPGIALRRRNTRAFVRRPTKNWLT